MRWAGLGNGDLLDAAEKAGFDALITGDKGGFVTNNACKVGR